MLEEDAGVPPTPSVEVPEETITSSNSSNPVVKCSRCNEPSAGFCRECGQDFCKTHRCLEHGFEIAEEPLVDDDGVEHKGRRIKLIGEGWPDIRSYLDTMSEEGLIQQIADWQRQLKDAIAKQDLCRILISVGESVKSDHSRKRRAKQLKELASQPSSPTRKAKPHAAPQRLGPDGNPIPQAVLSLMDGFNLDYATAVSLHAVLSKGH